MAEKIDRLTRVNELLKREIAAAVERLNFRAPGMLVSVTDVNAGVDLRNATVGISIFGGNAKSRGEVFHELAARRVDIQRQLAQTLGFKHTPVLNFKEDRTLEQGDRVLRILEGNKENESPLCK